MDEHHHHGDEEPPVTGRGGFETRPDHHASTSTTWTNRCPTRRWTRRPTAMTWSTITRRTLPPNMPPTTTRRWVTARTWTTPPRGDVPPQVGLAAPEHPAPVYSPMLQEWFDFTAPDFPLAEWIAPVFGAIVSTAVCPSCRWPCRRWQPPAGHDDAHPLAIVVAFVYSLAALPAGGRPSGAGDADRHYAAGHRRCAARARRRAPSTSWPG